MNKTVKICIFNKNTPKETVILSNGDAILDNICTSCKVTENLDGTYELDAEFIIDNDGLWEYIQEEAILKVKIDYGDEYFRIIKPRKTRNKIIIYAVQVTIYETIHLWINDVRPTGLNGTAAINWILDGAVGVKELEVYSNISASSTAYYENMNMYKAIHDCDQSFLNRWGGEIQRRGYLLRVIDKVGKDRGVQIRSCKNLRGFEANTDIDSITTRIKPKGYDGITIDGFIDSPIINNYARVYTKEFIYSDIKVKSSEDETEGFSTLEEAQAELERLAKLEYTENKVDIINADYTIDFVDLSQTEEYKDYIKAERVYIGDEVTVFESKLNINVVVRAIERKFNILTQKVEEIKLSNGDISRKSINDVMIDISKDIEKNDNSIEKWIQSFINAGIKDSYVFYNNEELVVCDSPTIEEAIHVWRFNKNGLAHSANGYQGPYDVALTANGQINANMILAGTLKGQYIDAKNLIVKDEDGNVTLSIDSKGNVNIRATDFTLEGKTIDSCILDKMLEDGMLTAAEKRQLQITLEDIRDEYIEIGAIASKYNINYNDLQTKYNTLHNYLTVDCKINDIETITNVSKDTLKTCFENYYLERANINNSINDEINTNINDKLSSSDSEAVFNALTNNGKKQGLYSKNGNLYFNGEYINGKNLKVVDSNGNTTFYINSDGIVEIIQGLIDISDEGIRINLEDSENNIVGYVVYDGQGVQIFTNDDEPISSFHREGSYAEKFVTDRLICPAVVQVADSNGCPLDWYIAPTSTGDGTGKDKNNKADSLSTVLRNIKNYGTKFDNKLTIHIEEGCIINENGLVIQDYMGTVFRLELGANVIINCEYFNIEDLSSRIFIEYVSDKRLVAGEITQADYDKYPIINATSDDAVMSVRHVDYAEIRGVRFEGVEGATGIKGVAGTNLVVDDCDFFGVDQCLKADGSSNVSLGWCSGNVDKLASIYNGSILTTSRRIPKYSNDEMVYVSENAIFIKSQYSYTQYDTLHNSSGSSSGGSGTNLNDVFSISTANLYTIVEGTGKVTSARKGYTGQGKYKNLKAHRGYIKLPIADIKSVMANKLSYELKLKLTRLNTEHGYNSKTPHPIFRATGGSEGSTDYWDSNVKFARGETQTLTLPTSIVQAIEKGADTLELWASSNQEQQYAFFGDVILTVEGENKVKEDDNKPGTDVGSGETTYSAVGTTTANLNVRKGAGTSYAIITTLPQGTTVNIVAKDNATGWYKITYNGAYGYVSNTYVTINSTGGGTTPSKDTIYDFPYADEMVEVATTYWRACTDEYVSGKAFSQGLTYRSSATPYSGSCVATLDVANSLFEKVTDKQGNSKHYKAIDCSSLSLATTKGHTYKDGPYGSKENFAAYRQDRLQKNNSYDWTFNMVKADGTLARDAASQAEYFDRVGLGIVYYRNVDTGKTYGSIGSASDNFAKIKKGDLIFYAKKSNGQYKKPDRYMKVSHVAICYGNGESSGKKSVIESTNLTTKVHTLPDGTTTVNAGVRIVTLEGNYGYTDDIVMVVRIQPSHYNGNIPGGGTESGGTGGGTTGDGVTDAGTTEYTNCISEQGTIDGNKYVYKLKTCKITAYGGDSGSACNIPLNLGKTCGSFNLPFGTKIYIPSLKGKSITDGNGKTVTCDGIFTVNDTGVGGTDFDLYMSTKSDTNAESVFGNTRREDVYILSYGSGYGYAWSYTQSYKWAYNNGTLSAYKVAFKDYIKYGGTLINFLKFKNDDANIRSSTYWSILNS